MTEAADKLQRELRTLLPVLLAVAAREGTGTTPTAERAVQVAMRCAGPLLRDDPIDLARPWRTGSKHYQGHPSHRTIYVQLGDEPSLDDPMIGVMDTPELAARVVHCVNAMLNQPPIVSETAKPSRKICTGLHCRCMNIGGTCPNPHHGDHDCPYESA